MYRVQGTVKKLNAFYISAFDRCQLISFTLWLLHLSGRGLLYPLNEEAEPEGDLDVMEKGRISSRN
jgi:hypothetical protein